MLRYSHPVNQPLHQLVIFILVIRALVTKKLNKVYDKGICKKIKQIKCGLGVLILNSCHVTSEIVDQDLCIVSE